MNKQIAQRVNTIQPFYVMQLLERAKQLEAQGRDIIHLEIGEPDFKSPAAVTNAAIAQLATGEVKYTQAAGLPELRQHIADYYQADFGVRVDPAQIIITPGASGALLLALSATLNAGDKLLLADPCYPCNRSFLSLLDAKAKLVPVDAETHYQLNADLVQQYWDSDVKGVLLASPSNPTGTVIPPDVLQELLAAVAERQGLLFVDEIYQGLVYDQQPSTVLQQTPEVFVLNSFSKYFGMTGWRIGWLVVPPAFTTAVEKLAQNIFIATSTPAQYGAIAAFSVDNRKELERRRQELHARRDFLYTALLKLGFEILVKPEGAFYIYANAQKFTHDSFQFAIELLEQEGVAITPGKDFGEHLANQHLRFAYTTSIARIAEAMTRLEHFIQGK